MAAAALVLAPLEKVIQQTADYCRQRKVRIVDRDKECMAAASILQTAQGTHSRRGQGLHCGRLGAGPAREGHPKDR